MKYFCNNCNENFTESSETREIKSKLIRLLSIKCPKCNSYNICLSEKGKLLMERKEKIKKIEKS